MVWLILLACAPKVLVVPGPTGALGEPPEAYAERVPPPAGAATTELAEARSPASPEEDGPREQGKASRRGARKGGQDLARLAGAYVGRARLEGGGTVWRNDCSGLVCAVHAEAGIDVGGGSSIDLKAQAQARGVWHGRGSPAVGDVVFFDDTYDRNRNGRLDDELTHVAIVEEVAADGTLTLVHRGSKGVVRIAMNLERPDVHRADDGTELNSYLRARTSRDPRGTRYLTGELYVGHASFWSAPEAS